MQLKPYLTLLNRGMYKQTLRSDESSWIRVSINTSLKKIIKGFR